MSDRTPLGLFEAYGIELEYMIVDSGSLDVRPRADRLLAAAAGDVTTEWEHGDYAWNNELALHVIEFKTNGPQRSLDGLAAGFAGEVSHANRLLDSESCCLMPGGMHPWMDPVREKWLWAHEDREIYDAFDRIFSCNGHGWINLQSMHINLPFSNDDEFGRLHAAIRFLMPIMPALAASTPIMDAGLTGVADNRLAVYRKNCARVPSVTGAVIPERVYTIGEYQDVLLAEIYRDLQPHDPAGILQEEWVNARGAIARFDRMALEIRVLDTQECPRMDLAYAALLVAVLRMLATESNETLATLQAWPTRDLGNGLDTAIASAERGECHDSSYLRALGMRVSHASLHTVWGHLAEQAAAAGSLTRDAETAIEHYLRYGSLATRIRSGLPAEPSRSQLRNVYRRLCECLEHGELFLAHS